MLQNSGRLGCLHGHSALSISTHPLYNITGYYIDYVSCYYMPTHDVYWEYYDSQNHFITLCATGYIATGIAKKISPWTGWYNVDWIQCCRLG